jgi:hypothetical protein
VEEFHRFLNAELLLLLLVGGVHACNGYVRSTLKTGSMLYQNKLEILKVRDKYVSFYLLHTGSANPK